MTQNNPQVPWTDEQWARVNQVIQEEASRARVAATFLPLVGPLPAHTDFVRAERIRYIPEGPRERINLEDKDILQLATLQVKLHVRGAQMADPEMASVLALFRRAANVLARLEDAVIFNGQPPECTAPESLNKLPKIWDITGGQSSRGLFSKDNEDLVVQVAIGPDPNDPNFQVCGRSLVSKVQESINKLERYGHFGPFAVVLGHTFFQAVTTPDGDSLVLPQDRIVPFLGGGSLLRSSLLEPANGVVVALGGTPVELVVASDMACDFLQVTSDPHSIFRVREKIVLRIKEDTAIVALVSNAASAFANRSAA